MKNGEDTERARNKLRCAAETQAAVRKLAEVLDIDIDLRTVAQYSAYMQGVRMAVVRMAEMFPQIERGKDGVYNRAIVKLAASSLRNADIFVNKTYTDIVVESRKLDRKGRCIECEVRFANRRTEYEIIWNARKCRNERKQKYEEPATVAV